ncbi:DHHA1 domain-containing protein, partial [uncultured Bartonella sp.]|uniref:DHHA1 domain-containing protein n=1 Tax=uncultured Bartonella sp. TaxID=104108 RepID=UPI00262CB85A
VDDAIAEGAMALFGEKYGDEVRVVSMGQRIDPTKIGNRAWSLELCGGTHVKRTGDIGLIRIVSESAVGAGVRRLEALTGEAARHYLDGQDERVHDIASALKTTPQEALERIHILLDERRKLEKELSEARKQLALSGGGSTNQKETDIEHINGISFMGRIVTGVSPRDLKPLADAGKTKIGSGVVAFIGVGEDGKASAVVGVTDDLTQRYNGVELVRLLSEILGGKGGGGRPDMAQAGGPDGDKAEAAMEALKKKL